MDDKIKEIEQTEEIPVKIEDIYELSREYDIIPEAEK